MRNEVNRIAAKFAFIKGTFFHPQWLAHREEKAIFSKIGTTCGTNVLDIGCSDQRIKRFLGAEVEYIGLDYYSTATEWYHTQPTIYGDAHALPFGERQFESVFLLDVLEHLARPETCMQEIRRVLKDGGTLFLKVPFLYPIHDAPFDFHRWTRFGLTQLAMRNGFQVALEHHIGTPIETAALLTNIAWSKAILRWMHAKNPLLILGIFLPFAVVATNLVSTLLSRLSSADDMMPHGYLFVFRKNLRD